MNAFIGRWSGLLLGSLLGIVFSSALAIGWHFVSKFETVINKPWLLYSYVFIFTEITFISLGYIFGSLIHKLDEEAKEDPLTQIPNRRIFEPAIKSIVEKGPTIMLLIDLDKFKLVNDQLGHLTGDSALAIVGKIIQKNIRQGDVCARFGGDEFAVLLPKARLSNAYAVAQRLLTEINAAISEIHQSCGVSIGIGAVEQGNKATTLIELADNALYHAKESGGKTIRHLTSPGF